MRLLQSIEPNDFELRRTFNVTSFETGFKMAKTGLMSSALSAAFIASIGFATPVHALEPKQCLPMAEMNAALKAEGQRTMIIGDRVYVDSPTDDIMDARFNRFVNTVLDFLNDQFISYRGIVVDERGRRIDLLGIEVDEVFRTDNDPSERWLSDFMQFASGMPYRRAQDRILPRLRLLWLALAIRFPAQAEHVIR